MVKKAKLAFYQEIVEQVEGAAKSANKILVVIPDSFALVNLDLLYGLLRNELPPYFSWAGRLRSDAPYRLADRNGGPTVAWFAKQSWLTGSEFRGMYFDQVIVATGEGIEYSEPQALAIVMLTKDPTQSFQVDIHKGGFKPYRYVRMQPAPAPDKIESATTAKLPRENVLQTVTTLRAGEFGYITRSSVSTDSDLSLWIESNATVRPQKHMGDRDVYIQKSTAGIEVTIPKDFRVRQQPHAKAGVRLRATKVQVQAGGV
jgi:hypothetical protein